MVSIFIAKIGNNDIIVYNKDLKETEKEINEYEGDYESSIKGKYEHFMLKEINEEPETLGKTTVYEKGQKARETVFTYLNAKRMAQEYYEMYSK